MVVQLDSYGRPSETLALSAKDHAIPTAKAGPKAHRGKWAVILAPGHLDVRSKNNDQDDAVIIGDGRHPWAADVLAQLVRIAGHGNLFNNLSLHEYERMFRKVTTQLHFTSLQITSHVVRHAGPSRDRMERSWTLQEIQRGGRWRSVHAALRQWSKLSAARQREVTDIAHKVPAQRPTVTPVTLRATGSAARRTGPATLLPAFEGPSVAKTARRTACSSCMCD